MAVGNETKEEGCVGQLSIKLSVEKLHIRKITLQKGKA